MNAVKYTKEFLYLFSGMTALFACIIGFITLMLAPFGLAIYLGDVLGFHDVITMGATVLTYYVYWVIARHFNWIEGIK